MTITTPTTAIALGCARACALALCLAGHARAADYPSFIVFGDSASDAGTFAPLLPPGTGKFTTNPGPIWTEVVADRLGVIGAPANAGGTNYAEGGARVSQRPGYPAVPPTGAATPIAEQVTHYLSQSGADSQALYSLDGGYNDTFYQIGLVSAGAISPTQAAANVQAAGLEFVEQVGRLQAAGARNIIVLNVYDLGRSPAGLAAGPAGAAALTTLSDLFNAAVTTGLAALGRTTLVIDVRRLADEVLNDPATYGFVDTTHPACGSLPSLVCTRLAFVAPDAAETYVFADTVHPTTRMHRIFAGYVESILDAAGKIALLPEASRQVYDRVFGGLDQRMRASMGKPAASGEASVYAIYDYAPWKIDGTGRNAGADLAGSTLVLGADAPLGPLLVGAAFAYGNPRVDFAHAGGGFALEEVSLTGYAGTRLGESTFVTGSVTAGDLTYKDVRRTFDLGPASRTESGDTRGRHLAATLMTGFTFRTGSLTHGPIARLDRERVEVNAYDERGRTSTTMRFGHQKVDTWRGRLAYQASYNMNAGRIGLRPYGMISWDTEIDRNERELATGLITTPGSLSSPVYQPDDNWFTGQIGAAADFTPRVAGFLGYTREFGRDDGTRQAIAAGMRIGF